MKNDLPVDHRINLKRYKPGRRTTLAQLRAKARKVAQQERRHRQTKELLEKTQRALSIAIHRSALRALTPTTMRQEG